jgi:hypothetical protein
MRKQVKHLLYIQGGDTNAFSRIFHYLDLFLLGYPLPRGVPPGRSKY